VGTDALLVDIISVTRNLRVERPRIKYFTINARKSTEKDLGDYSAHLVTKVHLVVGLPTLVDLGKPLFPGNLSVVFVEMDLALPLSAPATNLAKPRLLRLLDITVFNGLLLLLKLM
jgi:hypothetical protein